MRKNNKGFTLIEMLIVVAIIAILVAVSIPLVNNSLERARQATDAANERAAKAEAIIMYLNEDPALGDLSTDKTLQYDVKTGKLVESLNTGDNTYGKCSEHKDSFIKVTIKKNGDITVAWNSGNAAHNGDVADNNDG